MTLLTIFILLLFLYSLGSKRLERTLITPPILFTAAGMIVFSFVPVMPGHESGLEIFLRVAEAGLVLLLFTDASRTDLRVLKNIRVLPARLLSVGMLLTLCLVPLLRCSFSESLRFGRLEFSRQSWRPPMQDLVRSS